MNSPARAAPSLLSKASDPTRAPAYRIFKSALVAGLVAAGLNLVVFGIARALGASFVGQFQPDAPATLLPIPFVVMASVVPALVAAGFYLLLRAFFTAASPIFIGLATIFTLVSFAGPFGIAGASLATKLALNVMHLVAAAAITTAIARAARSGSPADAR